MRYYNLDEASDMLKIPLNKVIYYINKRQLRATQLGCNYRILKDDLLLFLKKNYGKNGIDIEAKL